MRRNQKPAPVLPRKLLHMITLQKAKPVLLKAVASGELSIIECGKIETQINECIKNPHLSLSGKYANFLLKKINEQPWLMA